MEARGAISWAPKFGGVPEHCDNKIHIITSGVSSYGAGRAAAPPLFGRVNKKSDIFNSVYSGIAADHAEKSCRFSICPATFFRK